MNLPAKPLRIFILPSQNKNNTYISLLISSLQKKGVYVSLLKKDSLWSVLREVFFNKRRAEFQNILHVQWSTVLYGSKFFLKSLVLIKVNSLLIVFLKIFFEFKIIWTVHNRYAHDYPHPMIDTLGRRVVFALADCCVVHEKATLAEYSKEHPQKNIQYVPHGNYIDVYGPRIDREQNAASQNLRKSFGFSESDIVLASFGAIAPYKLNEKIIEAVASAQKRNSRLKLLVAGKGNKQYVEKLSANIPIDSGIVIKNQFIPDADLPLFLSVADYSVFYYDESEMTSGGIILSLSYGVPVITRNIPASEVVGNVGENMVRSKHGQVFSTEKDLLEMLKNLQKESLQTSPNDIIKSVQKNDWSYSAERLKQIYESLFFKDTPAHS